MNVEEYCIKYKLIKNGKITKKGRQELKSEKQILDYGQVGMFNLGLVGYLEDAS